MSCKVLQNSSNDQYEYVNIDSTPDLKTQFPFSLSLQHELTSELYFEILINKFGPTENNKWNDVVSARIVVTYNVTNWWFCLRFKWNFLTFGIVFNRFNGIPLCDQETALTLTPCKYFVLKNHFNKQTQIEPGKAPFATAKRYLVNTRESGRWTYCGSFHLTWFSDKRSTFHSFDSWWEIAGIFEKKLQFFRRIQR